MIATTPLNRPSLTMRIASAMLSARARRAEGTSVDLASSRRAIDRITNLLRVPAGVSLTHDYLRDVPVVRLSSNAGSGNVVLYLHGGAYVLGSARQVLTCARLCLYGGPEIVSPEYRLAPEHPFPAAVDDALAVYRGLLDTHEPQRIVVIGESAGGGLTLLMLQRARAEGLPMPAAIAPAFPAADLTLNSHSSRANKGRDMLARTELVEEAAWFVGDRDLDDPAVSPLFGSFRGFPRTLISVGTRDLLLDDSRAVAAAMRAEGVDVRLVEWPGAVHGFTALPSPERRRHRAQLREFVTAALPPKPIDHPHREGPQPMTTTEKQRGRWQYAALGYGVRLIKAMPASIQERLLDATSGSVTKSLPPVPDLVRLLEASGGLPNGTLWQDRLLEQRPHLRAVRMREISGDTDGRLRARLYLPPTDAPTPMAALVWVHGGAFIIGSLDQQEAHWPAIELAASGIPVLSVDYRMCLDGIAYPAPQDDVLTAWRWAVAHADEIGVAPSQLHFGGGSAGGCLVAGATVRMRDAGERLPASLYLGYPVLQAVLPPATPEAADVLNSPGLPTEHWFAAMMENWAGAAALESPYVSPGLADLRGLPPTYVMSCGIDILRRASEPFAGRLADNDVPVFHEVFAESQHAPLDRPDTPDGDLAVSRLRTWLVGGVDAMD